MSYQLLQFNCGTDRAQGYVLQGQGEHEGTNVSVSPHEIEEVLYRNRQRLGSAYRPGTSSLLKGESKASPDDAAALAQHLDRRFLRQHAERSALKFYAEQLGCSEDRAMLIREASAAITLFAQGIDARSGKTAQPA